MADSFFGFDTSVSNLNDDEGGGGPSEDEYDALNDETFGEAGDDFDWEEEHEQLAHITETSRRHPNEDLDLETSLSQLVLDDTDGPSQRLGSSVWQHDSSIDPPPYPMSHTPVSALHNVCTVEELERRLRQKHPMNMTQTYFQPRFPVILQRPPGLQAPVPLPFVPQQSPNAGLQQNQLNHNQLMGQNNQRGPPANNHIMGLSNNQMMTQLNQAGKQMLPNNAQIGPTVSQILQNANQMGPSGHMMQNANPMAQTGNQMMQSANSMGQSGNQMIGTNHIGQQGANQIGQGNQMMTNGNQFGTSMLQNQLLPPHLMGQHRMMAPPGMGNVPRQNFNPNIGQYNPNFHGPMQQSNMDQVNQPNMMLNQQMMNQQSQQQMKNQSSPQMINQQMMNQNQINSQQMMSQSSPQMMGQQQMMNQSSPQMPLMTQSSPQIMNQQQMMNHQNQVKMNQKLANSIQRDPKSQQNIAKPNRSMVFNNSSQKNLSSQNLVQMIQNTHPMLQFNNSFHNANHHPVLNNRSNAFSNSQGFPNNHPMFNNQRNNNGGYTNNNTRYMMNGDDSYQGNGSGKSDSDEYSGLMSQREKQWLLNIQMLQLNTGTPYIDDFYYTVFLERQSRKEKEGVKEAHKANQQNHPFYSSGKPQENVRERHNSGRHNSTGEDQPTPRTYVPTQFENSLGKLQCGSVTAPRKIIDVEVVQNEQAPSNPGRQSRAPSVASTTHPLEVPREVRRTKQLLLDIEALYCVLLRLEELNEPLAIANALVLKEREDKQKQLLEQAQKELDQNEEDTNVFLRNIESVQRKPKDKVDSPKSETMDKRQVVNLNLGGGQSVVTRNLLDENKDELVNKIFAGLLFEDRLQQFMSVRKGKALLARFCARVPASHVRLRALWSRVLRALPTAARRDARDNRLLPTLAPYFRRYILNSTGWAAILEACGLLNEALDPARTPHVLSSPFTLNCVISLIEKASTLVSTPEATSSERQWTRFLKNFARACRNATAVTVARPAQPMPESKLFYHIKLLESRSTVEILPRGKTASEFADLSKNEFSEQLIKHLC